MKDAPETRKSSGANSPTKTTKGKTITNSIAPTSIIDRLTNSFEAALLEEESRYAAQSIRTIRISKDLNKYHPETPVYVLESNGRAWAASGLGATHPALTAAAGDSFEFVAEDKSLQKQKFIGMFDLVAQLTRPATTGHGERITLLAEHTPAA